MGKSKSSLKISKINVTSPVVCATYNHKTVGFYLVETVIKEGDVSTNYQIYHHFQEFRDLHTGLEKEYKDDHVKNMLPAVPPKEITWFTDHTSPDFLDKRKKLLKQYMKELIKIPRMEKDQNVLSFLGYFKKGVREVSLLFDDDLGLRIQPNEKDDYKVSIMAFTRGKDKLPGMAEESGLVYMNDVISSVDGEPTLNKSFEEVKAMIALSGRPIILTFRGNPSKAPEKVVVEKEDKKKSDSDDDDSDSDSDSGKKKKKNNNKPVKKGKKPVTASSSEDEDENDSEKDSDEDSDSDDDKKKKKSKSKGKGKSKPPPKKSSKFSKKKVSSSDDDEDDDDSDKDSDSDDDSDSDKKKKKSKKPIPPPPKSKSKIPSLPKKKKGSDSSDSDSDSDSKPVKPKSKSVPNKKKNDSDSDSSDSDRIVIAKRGGRARKQSNSAEKLAVNAAVSSDSSDSDIDPSV